MVSRPAWTIEWAETAFRDISKLEKPIARRIFVKLEQAAVDPMRFFERLVGSADFKLRVGDYRVVALLSIQDRIVFIERGGHRSKIYERRGRWSAQRRS